MINDSRAMIRVRAASLHQSDTTDLYGDDCGNWMTAERQLPETGDSVISILAGGNRTSLRFLLNPHRVAGPEPRLQSQSIRSLNRCPKVLPRDLYWEDLISASHLTTPAAPYHRSNRNTRDPFYAIYRFRYLALWGTCFARI